MERKRDTNQCLHDRYCLEFEENDGKANGKLFIFHFSMAFTHKTKYIFQHKKAGTDKPDVALIKSDVICEAAAVYTTNKVKGAPLAVTKEHLKDGKAVALICNSGNANTCVFSRK